MGLLDSVIGALGSQGGGASGGGGTQAALLQAIVGMLMQGGQGGGQGGGLGAMLGGLAQAAGGGQAGGGQGGLGGLGGGLGALVEQFSRAGMGDAARSWVSTGQNQPVSADQISQVFGGDTIAQLARQLGLAPNEVAGQMSQMLPEVVDRLTPGGQIPQGNDLAALGDIDGLLNGLLRR